MKFHEFAGKVKEEVAALCGEGYEIGIQEVKKNNGVVRTGIFMKREGEPLGPILYLDGYYDVDTNTLTLNNYKEAVKP